MCLDLGSPPGTMSIVTERPASNGDEEEATDPYEDYIFKRNPLRFLEDVVRNIMDWL